MDNTGAEILREVYASRSVNRNYSLRSFARDLGLSHTYLSLVFRDKKRLPLKTLHALVGRLGIDPGTLPASPAGAPSSVKRQNEFSRLEIDRFRLMTRWYHTALLELVQIKHFHFSVGSAAVYLGLEIDEVREALASLRRLGLMKLSGAKWTKAESRVSIVAPTSVEAIRAYHRQMISKALSELSKTDEGAFKRRDITGMTMPINPRRIAGAKKRIAQFRRSLEAYLTQGECTEVYQLNVQLFPLRAAGRDERKMRECL